MTTTHFKTSTVLFRIICLIIHMFSCDAILPSSSLLSTKATTRTTTIPTKCHTAIIGLSVLVLMLPLVSSYSIPSSLSLLTTIRINNQQQQLQRKVHNSVKSAFRFSNKINNNIINKCNLKDINNNNHRRLLNTNLNIFPISDNDVLSTSSIVETTTILLANTVYASSSTATSTDTSFLFGLINEYIIQMNKDTAELVAGPFFGLSLFPYLLFLYFLNYTTTTNNNNTNIDNNVNTPKGIIVGFTACLLFVFLTIPAAIAAKLLYNVSLADSDWLHGSAESMLTITNLITVIPFRQALNAQQQQQIQQQQQQKQVSSSSSSSSSSNSKQQQQQLRQQPSLLLATDTAATVAAAATTISMPISATQYKPMVQLLLVFTGVAVLTAVVPAINNPQIHTLYLNGFLDVPQTITDQVPVLANEPDNALSIATWIIHISSLVEFLVIMGYCWRWSDVTTNNNKWKGLTWGLLPLHTSGITACVSHLFYNTIYVLVPIQAILTCIGNTTAAYAAYRIAVSNGWTFEQLQQYLQVIAPWYKDDNHVLVDDTSTGTTERNNNMGTTKIVNSIITQSYTSTTDVYPQEVEEATTAISSSSTTSLIGFEDLGDALANDNDYTFILKLFFGCTIASYFIKYGELYIANGFFMSLLTTTSSSSSSEIVTISDTGTTTTTTPFLVAMSLIIIPSLLNAYKWYRRSNDSKFEGWF